MAIATINPTTGQTIKTFTGMGKEEVIQALEFADRTFQDYRHTSLEQRSTWLYEAATILEAKVDQWASLMTLEMGKPINSAIAEVKKCALVCRYYADHGAAMLEDTPAPTDGSNSFIRYQPLGAILAVMPWNFPFWQVFRFAAPSLMAGNTALLKHASNVPQCALAIAEIFTKAGFPEHVFQTLLIGADLVDLVIRDSRVKAATLTGSEYAGSCLAAAAGKALKPTVLELGGSDPYIVMPSADLEEAVTVGVTARMLNNGQSCIAAKRMIIHEAIATEFIDQLTAKYQALTVGDPADPATDIGPLATQAIVDELAAQVDRSIELGTEVIVGGQRLNRPGFFYPPTILTSIPPEAPAAREELFGPVSSIFVVADIDDAIALANDTDLGLGASAWTKDPQEQQRFINEIEAGAVFINGMTKSDPRIPFGGIKRSGYGRELGLDGIRAFVNAKTVWIK